MPRPSADPRETAEFLLRLRGRGISDVEALRALERVPRRLFAPQRYSDLAMRDIALPIGCGQTMPSPLEAARVVEALRAGSNCRVLEIGSGSGYVTALIATLAAEVLSLERFSTLAIAARARLAALGVDNAAIVGADGLDPPAGLGGYDRVVVHARLDEAPARLLAMLGEGGFLLAGRSGIGGVSLTRLTPTREGFDETRIAPMRLTPLIPGLALAS